MGCAPDQAEASEIKQVKQLQIDWLAGSASTVFVRTHSQNPRQWCVGAILPTQICAPASLPRVVLGGCRLLVGRLAGIGHEAQVAPGLALAVLWGPAALLHLPGLLQLVQVLALGLLALHPARSPPGDGSCYGLEQSALRPTAYEVCGRGKGHIHQRHISTDGLTSSLIIRIAS